MGLERSFKIVYGVPMHTSHDLDSNTHWTVLWAAVRDAERLDRTAAERDRARQDLDAAEAEALATRHAAERRARRLGATVPARDLVGISR